MCIRDRGLCKLLCWLPLTASINTAFLPSSAGQSYTHCCTLTTRWLKHSQPPLPSPHRATDGDRRPPFHPHWCHIASTVAYLGSLTYCATLGGAFDRDHWSRSAVTIIYHFVKWSRQALADSQVVHTLVPVPPGSTDRYQSWGLRLYSWEGNRRSKWFIRLWTQWPCEGDKHPAYTVQRLSLDLPFC